jgi:hypothetical protein
MIINVVGEGPYSINPSSTKRTWMDDTFKSHAYRCLPLNSANSHGWTINLNEECIVDWNGKDEQGSVKIISGSGEENISGGYVTFKFPFIFTTPEEFYLWCSGQPNYIRSDMSALNAIVRSDWYPSTFQFTWKLHTAGRTVFEKNMPIMFFMPYPKNIIDEVVIYQNKEETDNKKKIISSLYSEYINKSIKRISQSLDPWKEWMGLYRKGKFSENSNQLVQDPMWVPKPSKIQKG